ncbi:hypothetical protein EOM81_11535 [bacterium]|nr:hypothetical protein [bacterium]
MQNLLKETIEVLAENGKSEADVLWVGNKKAYVSWADFAEYAKNLEYDSGYGGNEIDGGLLVVGLDWWLERHEYDGSEWWEFKSLPIKPKDNAAVDVLADTYYLTDEERENRCAAPRKEA